MKATVLYYSHTGKTAAYAKAIAMYLWSKGLNVSLSSISDFDKSKLDSTDILFSGCWTCGWFVVGQHPHKKWRKFSKGISGILPDTSIMFFTTYKFCAGSMLYFMKSAMGISGYSNSKILKSKNVFLSDTDKTLIDEFIKNNAK
ncbi:MAG: flavodoxin domain-containing protein [Phocaeicola sp.]|nr:flavodoxin domain-containing protein [Phocaeicola sp.]